MSTMDADVSNIVHTSEHVDASESTSELTESKDVNLKQAFQIISISEDGTHFVLNEDNLKIIVAQIKKLEKITEKLVIISIVGAFRTGKSFMLSSFIRYLEYCEASGIEVPQEEPGNAEWLKSSDRLTHGSANADNSDPGFVWRGGEDRMTTGMWIYGQPYVRTLPGSTEKAVVLLMDTQGMFDMKTGKALTNAIFGLSTLISSYQIFNQKTQIQENVLDELDMFTSLAIAALKGLEETTTNPTGNEENKTQEVVHPFQTLELLIRDYPHFEDHEDVKNCLTEMDPYLEGILSSKDREHDDGMRERIKKTFSKITCFLLSHPGVKMAAKKWDGELSKIEEHYISLLDHYVRRVFEKNIIAKQIQGRMINGPRFEHYIKAYIKVFKDGKVPEAKSLVQAIGDATNLSAKEEALTLYTIEMDKLCTSHLGNEELANAHKEILAKTTSFYEHDATLGNPDAIQKVKKSLLVNLKTKFGNYKERNKTLLHAAMQKYVIPVLAAVLAYFLDWASDFLCDSWSSSCRQVSRLLFIGYFFVSLLLLYELGKIYKSAGSYTASRAALSFAQNTIAKGKEISDETVLPMIAKMRGESEKEKTE